MSATPLPAHDFENENLAAAIADKRLVASDCYWTPQWVFEALTDEQGQMLTYDLDPCSPGLGKTFVPTAHAYSLENGDDGLRDPWFGRVFANPPYSKKARIDLWMERCAEHGNTIALVNANVGTRWFQQALRTSDAVVLLDKRVAFINAATGKPQHGNSKGQALLAWGADNAEVLARSGLGYVVR